MASIGVAGGAWAVSRYGRPGSGFPLAVLTCILLRLSLGLGGLALAALLGGTVAYLVGSLVAFVAMQAFEKPRVMGVVAEVDESQFIVHGGSVGRHDLDPVAEGPGLGFDAAGRLQHTDFCPGRQLLQEVDRIIAHPRPGRRQR